MSASAAVGDGGDSPPFIERMYKLYRDYIEHEDQLIHNRLTLLITIESFIFIGYGYVLQRAVDSRLPTKDPIADGVCAALKIYELASAVWLFVIALFGVVLAFRSLQAVKAAVDAISALELKWQNVVERFDMSSVTIENVLDEATHKYRLEWAHAYLPNITGGGARAAHWKGLRMPQALPKVILFAWLAVAVVTIGIGVYQRRLPCPQDNHSTPPAHQPAELGRT